MSLALGLLRLGLLAVFVVQLTSSQDAGDICAQHQQVLSELQNDVAELKAAIIHRTPPHYGELSPSAKCCHCQYLL